MSEIKTSSVGYSRLGLIGVSLFAMLGACSAAISLLETTDDGIDNINLNVDGLMSEWDMALAYSKSSSLLNESQNVHGKLLVEGLFSGVIDAMTWACQKIGK